jgi:ornithine carbamoyltransferase
MISLYTVTAAPGGATCTASNVLACVVNGLTNEYHPCQVFADVFTYIEHRGSIAGKCVAWVGDANNMLYSWLQAAEVFGFHLNVSTPVGYDINPALVSQNNLRYTVFKNPADACAGADLVTTDVWTSMGYEQENVARLKAFDGWIVDSAKMQRANPDALFMDCREVAKGAFQNGWNPNWCVAPDVVADFRNMPFPDGVFRLVVYDPPHLTSGSMKSVINKKYRQ